MQLAKDVDTYTSPLTLLNKSLSPLVSSSSINVATNKQASGGKVLKLINDTLFFKKKTPKEINK